MGSTICERPNIFTNIFLPRKFQDNFREVLKSKTSNSKKCRNWWPSTNSLAPSNERLGYTPSPSQLFFDTHLEFAAPISTALHLLQFSIRQRNLLLSYFWGERFQNQGKFSTLCSVEATAVFVSSILRVFFDHNIQCLERHFLLTAQTH